ncbi:hypothetical protein MHYP_G00102550 [Metynnis hypsauchen]
MSNGKSCANEPMEVVHPKRVQLEQDGESNEVLHSLTVWRTGWTETTAEEGLRWWHDNVKTYDVGHSWSQEETADGVPWFHLTYWRTGFFLNGANEHLRPGRRIERDTKNQTETKNQGEIENSRETKEPATDGENLEKK